MMEAAMDQPTGRRRTAWAWTSVVIHAAVVLAMAGQLLWWDLHPTIDANIGAGFLMFALIAAGFPWSIAAFSLVDGSQTVRDIAIIATALLNLGIHWAIIRGLTRPDDAVAS